ncbi:MAG: aminotransferase class IV, partial [Cytophagaceae bacterium]
SYKFVIITSPVQSYFSGPIKVCLETKFSRADEGGVGFAKTSGNYGRALLPTYLAEKKGYQQIIWTDAHQHQFIEEAGTMNLMFIINGILITPPLSNSILPGITRDSILKIARKKGIKVQERLISIKELFNAYNEGSLEDAFGTGTAANLTHISQIDFEDQNLHLPPINKRIISSELLNTMDSIKKGLVEDEFGWVYKIQPN